MRDFPLEKERNFDAEMTLVIKNIRPFGVSLESFFEFISQIRNFWGRRLIVNQPMDHAIPVRLQTGFSYWIANHSEREKICLTVVAQLKNNVIGINFHDEKSEKCERLPFLNIWHNGSGR